MKKDMPFELDESARILEHDQRVILGSANSGEWTKISRECYEILKTAMQGHYTVRDFINAIQEERDKLYMQDLLDKLLDIGIVTQDMQRKGNVPKSVTFAITDQCNLRCRHCCMSAGDIPDILSLEECKQIIEKVITINPKEIVFTGGEPLIKPGFLSLLRYTRDRFEGHIGIMTNGTLFSEKNLPEIVKLVDSIDISIDGVDEESCAKIRGKGVFSKVMKAIDMLHAHKFNKISLSMVMTKENKGYMETFFELNKKKGTKPMLRSFSPIGRGENNRNELESENNQKERVPKAVLGSSDMRICSCGALKRTIYIYHGYIFPCPILFDEKYSMGKILDQENLLQYFSDREIERVPNYKNFSNLYPQNYPHCKDCDVNLFCWSCLHHVDLLQKGVLHGIHHCEERKKQLQEIIWEEE